MRFRKKIFLLLGVLFLFISHACTQQVTLFEKISLDSLGIRVYKMLCTKGGSVDITSSTGLWKMKGREIIGAVVSENSGLKNFRSVLAEDGIRDMVEGPDSIFAFATHDNRIFFMDNGDNLDFFYPPFFFPPKGAPFDKIASLFIDSQGDLYIGTYSDNLYFIKEGANKQSFANIEATIIDSVLVFKKGEKKINKILVAPQTGVFSFAQDAFAKNILWMGTNNGLYSFNKTTQKNIKVSPGNSFTVTHIEIDKKNDLWFSTLENGMGCYDQVNNKMQFYPYPKSKTGIYVKYPINSFCYKSADEFFVAVMDSLPAVFNKKTGIYTFIHEPIFGKSTNNTVDIKVDRLGNLFVIKGGTFYFCSSSKRKLFDDDLKRRYELQVLASGKDSSVLADTDNVRGNLSSLPFTPVNDDTNNALQGPDSGLLAPFISYVYLYNGELIASQDYYAERLRKLTLNYDQNSFIILFGTNDLSESNQIQFAWKMEGITTGWNLTPPMNLDSSFATIMNLSPGEYLFELKVKIGNSDWRQNHTRLIIIVYAPYWQKWWFWTSIILGLALLFYTVIKLRVRAVRKTEKLKSKYERELLELESKALRAQMNPHFIFNCMNSIKVLMQEREIDKGVTYLTVFSKLIRVLFNNADKKQISLYDEIETCKLYLQLEAMRFDKKFSYEVIVGSDIDLKSIQVPALIVQPFIENAIWHGLIPRNAGGFISLNVVKKNEAIEIIIDDDGIGRATSAQNKSNSNFTHQSKGMNITQSRLELNNLLQQRQAKLEIIDKKDERGIATGTTVIINLDEEIS